eukprot:gnl/MRDRNA2_/MRDRNA2_18780_c0_seq1.p1 gnl/MRDRNA2_/MRDRNA2_18780_c0~~gnl/MRDRNA2_/MRDRNA2_18780_c0_seq1.p1  ORF type:complete len:276 (-),score=50.41 gnl/MRDRNA2_/MRDRNA2_18780_c0_seq1:77-904(-)
MVPWYAEPEDPDREINPIILQFMAKSTLRAVLSDKHALKATMDKRGLDVNTEKWELTDCIYSQLKQERLARAKELQRQFVTYLMESNGDYAALLKDVFASFARAVKEQKEERAPLAPAEVTELNSAKKAVTEKKSVPEGWKKLKAARSQPDFGRLMKGLKRGEAQPSGEGSLIGASIQVVDSRDPRSLTKGLTIQSESTKGQAWELSDGSFVTKDHQGTRWVVTEVAKPVTEIATRSSSTGTIRRRPSVSEMRRMDPKVARPPSRSGSKQMPRRR